MGNISFTRHRFPPEVIRHAVWLYARFTLSYRDVAHPNKLSEGSNDAVRGPLGGIVTLSALISVASSV